jgi:hypothetical protein
MTDIITLSDHRPDVEYLFIGGPKDGQRAHVAGEPQVFDTSTPAEPISPRGGDVWPREWIPCTYIKQGSNYVYQETTDARR